MNVFIMNDLGWWYLKKIFFLIIQNLLNKAYKGGTMKKQRGPTLSLRAKGPLAIFTRPELKTERVSYEIPTPSSVRGIFEAICWKPAIQWHVERIYVFNEISFTAMKRNELNSKSIMPSKQMMDCGMREFTHGIYGLNVESD